MQIAGGIGANRTGSGCKTIHQLQESLRGDVLQWYDRDAVSRFGVSGRTVYSPCADRIANWGQAIAGGVANKRDAADPERALKHEDDIGFCDRMHRYEADSTLDTRVNRVAGLQDIAEHHFGDGGDWRAFEIEIIAATVRRRLRTRTGNVGDLRTLIYHGLRPRTAARSSQTTRLLRIPRQDIKGTDLVDHIDIRIGDRASRINRGGVAGTERQKGRNHERNANAAADREGRTPLADTCHTFVPTLCLGAQTPRRDQAERRSYRRKMTEFIGDATTSLFCACE